MSFQDFLFPGSLLDTDEAFILWLTHGLLSVSLSLADLRKFRSYKGGSVRDLLRAMRNKVGMYSHVLCLKETGLCR